MDRSKSENEVRQKIQVLRTAAKPFLIFQGEIQSGAVANYADTVDVCKKGLRLCDAVEKLIGKDIPEEEWL